jgi:hypothetical protein
MSRYSELNEENEEVFIKVVEFSNLHNYINFKFLHSDKLKEIGKVVRANDLTKYSTGIDLFILVNELVYDQLEDLQKEIVAKEITASIHYDTEKDKIVLTKPDFTTYSLLLDKYGYDEYKRLKESIKAAFQQRNEEE